MLSARADAPSMDDIGPVQGLLQAHVVGLAMALGAGLLIGVERERRKGQGDDREAAGLRSFVVAAVSAALAQALSIPGLVAVGALCVALLAALSYWKSRSRDPGLTTPWSSALRSVTSERPASASASRWPRWYAHAPIASLASLHAAGALPVERVVAGVLVAISANTLTRCTVAAIAGGRAYALRVSTALLLSLSLAWLAAGWTLMR